MVRRFYMQTRKFFMFRLCNLECIRNADTNACVLCLAITSPDTESPLKGKREINHECEELNSCRYITVHLETWNKTPFFLYKTRL